MQNAQRTKKAASPDIIGTHGSLENQYHGYNDLEGSDALMPEAPIIIEFEPSFTFGHTSNPESRGA